MIKKTIYSMLFFFTALIANAQSNKLVASCCVIKKEEAGRCTGSAYCSACSNCSRCAHCSNGGSCGVCASYSQPVRYTAPRTATPSKSRATSSSKNSVSTSFNSETSIKSKRQSVNKKVLVNYRPEEMVAVNSEILNLREGAGTEYEIIEVLKKYDLLMIIAIDGEWLQVKVMESGNFGYVKAEYVYRM